MYGIWKQKKGGRIEALVLFLAMLVMTWLTYKDSGNVEANLYIALGISILAGLFSLLKSPTKTAGKIIGILLVLLIPLGAVLCLQGFTMDILRIYPLMLGVNYVLWLLLYLLSAFACKSVSIGYSLVTVIVTLLGMVNSFVVEFRGNPIVPWDVYSVRTAASVVGNYTYVMTWRVFFSLAGCVFLFIAGRKIRIQIENLFVRIAMPVLCAAAFGTAGYFLQKPQIQNALDMDTTLFTPSVMYRNNGFLASFISDLHLINVKKPEGYSPEKAEAIAREASAGYLMTGGRPNNANVVRPNIVVIMDEAFSDLAVLGKFNVNTDYMPNMHALMQQYAGGQMMVSVKGGNTANTEYEFLTGDTMAFLPEGSVAYQQFVNDNVPALPSYLTDLGYRTTAIHPYYPGGWNRADVYEKLGFRSFLSLADFVQPQKLRGYVSDEAAFGKIIELFRQKEANEPQFVFEVTMQNHGGYSKDTDQIPDVIRLTDIAKPTTQTRSAEKYLTLLKKTDEALGRLIEYFSTYKEPTIVVFFGDHQPSDYITSVISTLTGYQEDASVADTQRQYEVPYLVWSNYDVRMVKRSLTSPNYLAANILEAAGLDLTAYDRFLLQLQKQLPVISSRCCVDADGYFYSVTDAEASYQDVLSNYQILEYNHLIDSKNRVAAIFTEPAAE